MPTAGVFLVRADTLDPQSILGGSVPNPVLADDIEQALIGPPMKAFAVVRVERVVDYAPLAATLVGFVNVDQKLPCRQKVLAHIKSTP